MAELLLQEDWLLPVLFLVVGLMIGSFLNVVILRIPRMMDAHFWRWFQEQLVNEAEPAFSEQAFSLLEIDESQRRDIINATFRKVEKPPARYNLVTPNSHCPNCAAAIRPWQNVPVLSYLLLRGKCASCAAPISPRYPLIELVTGLMTLALALSFPLSWALFGAALLTWALIALTVIDVDHQLLPDSITLPLLWLGLLFNVGGVYVPLADAVIGAAAGYLILWSIYWLFRLTTGREGMGYGDFKLLAALGAWMGWQSLHMIILMSSVVGAVIGIVMIAARRRGREVPIPFGPYLAAAGWITLLWGDALIAHIPLLDIWPD